MNNAEDLRNNFQLPVKKKTQFDRIWNSVVKASKNNKYLEVYGEVLNENTLIELRKRGCTVIEGDYANEREDSYYPNKISW